MQIGPRLEMQLVKVQEGVAEGQVLYHRFQSRSSADVASQQIAIEEAARLRAERRRQQEENIRKKTRENARIQAALQVLNFCSSWCTPFDCQSESNTPSTALSHWHTSSHSGRAKFCTTNAFGTS